MASFSYNKLYSLRVGQCFNSDGKIEKCSTKFCVANFHTYDDDDEVYRSQSCTGEDKIELVGLWFTAIFNLNLSEMTKKYLFLCKYYGCNDESIINKSIDLFHEGYDFKSVLKRFGNAEEEEQTTASFTYSKQTASFQSSIITNLVSSISTKSSIESTTTTTTTTNLPTSTTTTNLLTSTSITSSSKSITTESSASTSYIKDTVTTMSDSTTRANHGLHTQRMDGIIYIALSVFMVYLFFLT